MEVPDCDTTDRIPLPAESEIIVVEDSPERLVIHVPRGGPRTKFLGWSALALVLIAWAVNFAPWIQRPVGPLPQFERIKEQALDAILPAIAALFIAWWIILRFERASLLVEHDRFAIQKNLFGWRRITETAVDQNSRALVVEHNQSQHFQTDVVVTGVERQIRIGRTLTDDEQVWLVMRINQFLGTPTEAPVGLPANDDPWADVSPGPLPRLERPLPAFLCQSKIRVVESTFDRLELFIPGGGPQARMPPRSVIFRGFLVVLAGIPVFHSVLEFRDPYVAILLLIAWLAGFSWFGLRIWRWLESCDADVTLRLNREFLNLERVFFRRRRVVSTSLVPESRARIVIAYRDQHGDGVEVSLPGINRDARFGLALSTLEKEWLVEQINEFLELSHPTDATS